MSAEGRGWPPPGDESAPFEVRVNLGFAAAPHVRREQQERWLAGEDASGFYFVQQHTTAAAGSCLLYHFSDEETARKFESEFGRDEPVSEAAGEEQAHFNPP